MFTSISGSDHDHYVQCEGMSDVEEDVGTICL